MENNNVSDTETKETDSQSVPQKRLFRSESNKIIAGVCGGLGEYFDLDPTIIRIAFVVLFFLGGSGFLLYFVLWLVIPNKSDFGGVGQDTIKASVEEMKNTAKNFGTSIGGPKSRDNNSNILALVLLGLGIVFLLRNFGIFDVFDAGRLWPLVLVIIGLVLLLGKK